MTYTYIHSMHTLHHYSAYVIHLRNNNYYNYRFSGAYEALRDSSCIKLPSQRTLRDYTHYVEASTGFSSEVDKMLIQVAKVNTCPECEMNVILLDEMHIREDIVFDKHSGAMIGFTKLGDINDHLLQFERSLTEDQPSPLAKSMMVFMVWGLFSKLQFPYAVSMRQFVRRFVV